MAREQSVCGSDLVPVIQTDEKGTAVVVAVGNEYYVEENSLAPNDDPTYTPTFTLKNIRINCTSDMAIKFNSTENSAWTAKAGKEYTITALNITSIIVTNAGAGDIYIFGTD